MRLTRRIYREHRAQPPEAAGADLRRRRCRRDDRPRHEAVRGLPAGRLHRRRPAQGRAADPRRAGARHARHDLPRIIAERRKPDEVLVAIPARRSGGGPRRSCARSSPSSCRSRRCRTCAICSTARSTVSQIRAAGDRRPAAAAPVGLDAERVSQLIKGKRVLVTGAAARSARSCAARSPRSTPEAAGALRALREQPVRDRERPARRARGARCMP